jgi:hypothetical protein
MLARIIIAGVAALVIGCASAALAAPAHRDAPALKPGGCVTDEGQGRYAPC